MYHGHTHYYQATMLVIAWGYSLLLTSIYADVSDGKHVCSKYHGHNYYQAMYVGISAGHVTFSQSNPSNQPHDRRFISHNLDNAQVACKQPVSLPTGRVVADSGS